MTLSNAFVVYHHHIFMCISCKYDIISSVNRLFTLNVVPENV